MKIIKDKNIEYDYNFYKIANEEVLNVIKTNSEELEVGSIPVCNGKRRDKNFFVAMNLKKGIPSFEVYESENYQPHTTGSVNYKVYDNLEDAYYDFLCRVIGFVYLDDIKDIKRYVFKLQNKKVNLNIRIPDDFDFKIKINKCSHPNSQYDKYVGEVFNVCEFRQHGYEIGKYDENDKLIFATYVGLEDAEILEI